MSKKQSLAQRTISSIGWNFVGSLAQIVLGFVRSVLLARLLQVETFGVYTWAKSIVVMSAILPGFGLSDAFMHRSSETADEQKAAANYFTLQTILTTIWGIALVIVAVFFTRSGGRQTALLWITLMTVGTRLAATPRLILTRRVIHRRLTIVQLTDFFLSTVVALVLAWRGTELWALLSTELVTLLVNIVGFYVWRPVWRPRLHLSWKAARYFLSFGSRNVLASAFLHLLDRVDDLWVGTYMGNVALGLYSRAYTFATYPRKILGAPIQSVSTGAYAELTENRKRLSQFFYRTNAVLVRANFLLAGILALIAPEFVRILLGAKWLPMVDTFRLMLVYTLLDPLKLTISNVFIAVGKPERIARTRAIQLLIMVIGLFTLGPWLGITGVALAVDVMILVGIGILLLEVRTYVDYSLRKLLLVPSLALIAGLVPARLSIEVLGYQGADWITGVSKASVFLVIYCTVLLLLEFRNLLMLVNFLRSVISRRQR